MRTLLLLAFTLTTALGFGQTTVSGKVVDQNNEPIPGANVVIVGKAIGTVSDFDGNFNLQTDENPPFDLQISSLGYTELRNALQPRAKT